MRAAHPHAPHHLLPGVEARYFEAAEAGGVTGQKPAGMLSPGAVMGLLVVLPFVCVIASTALFVAFYPMGNSSPDDASACQAAAEVPPRDGVRVDQDTPATAERTWFPPSIVCSVDVYQDWEPGVTVHENRLATVVAILALGVAAALLIRLLVAATFSWRTRCAARGRDRSGDLRTRR